MKKLAILIVSHGLALLVGFMGGIYALPILTAPDAPSIEEVASKTSQAEYNGEFRRDLSGSDFLHWGEGTISVGRDFIALEGEVAAGPDYKLYLSPEFVEDEAQFNALKAQMIQVGDIKTFKNFILPVPEDINPGDYKTVVVWCESFGEFITAANYQ